MTQLLKTCHKQKNALCAFNVYNLETILAVVNAAQTLKSPVIVAFGERYFSYAPIEAIGCLVKELGNELDFPVVLHLDHAKNLSSIIKSIKCGFTSVMYDGSDLDFKTNIKNTRKIVDIAHSVGVSVEGELGYSFQKNEHEPVNMRARCTRPENARIFVDDTGVNALAVAIGNIHGTNKGTVMLDIDRLMEIRREVDIPLVLHGCSGLPDDKIREVISKGICKININSKVSIAAVNEARIVLEEKDSALRFEKLMLECRIEMTDVVRKYISLCM